MKGAIMPRGAYLVLAIGACLALSGCASNQSQPTYKYRIAVIPKGLTHEFWLNIERGARRAGTDLTAEGIPMEILWDGPTKESDARDQINLIQQKSNMGIQGMVLAPQHSQQMVAPVEEVVRRGIPVVIIDSGLDAATLKRNPDLIVKYVATNNYKGGRLAAQHMLDVLARRGKKAPRLVLFRYQPGSESTEQREQGFLDAVARAAEEHKKKGEPGPEVIDKDEYALATVETAEKHAGVLLSRLQGHEPDGIFCVNESSTTGLLNALLSLGLNGKIHVIGFDSSARLQEAVRKQDIDALIVQDPYRMAYLGVYTVVRHLEHKDVSGGGKYYGTGEHVLTRENIDQPQMRGLFDKDVQAQRTIELPDFLKN
jgi:ribose transport system substrate-binding protein